MMLETTVYNPNLKKTCHFTINERTYWKI